ncbi:MAG TPA: hypothetical protein VF230_00430 [Acidimicrobiales bacterium]
MFLLAQELAEAARRTVLRSIEHSAAFVHQPRERLALSVGVFGPMDEALASAVQAVRTALEAVGDPVVDEVRMIPHSDAARQFHRSEPISYYGVTECASALGVTRQRVQQLLREEKLPAPSATIGGRPIWRADEFDAFAIVRRELVRNTPLGLDPTAFGPHRPRPDCVGGDPADDADDTDPQGTRKRT